MKSLHALDLCLVCAAVLAVTPARSEGLAPAALAPSIHAATRSAVEGYSTQLHTAVLSAVHYPNSREARQLRPTGLARVWVELDRQGTLLASGIATPSGSPLLDAQALQTLRNCHFPAFPADSTMGTGARRFVVPVEFVPDGQG